MYAAVVGTSKCMAFWEEAEVVNTCYHLSACHLCVLYASVFYQTQTSYAIKMCVSDLLQLYLLNKNSIEWQSYAKKLINKDAVQFSIICTFKKGFFFIIFSYKLHSSMIHTLKQLTHTK